MVCDGVTSDDGTPADGVQTSRKCGCGSEISGACANVEIDLTLSPYYDVNDPACGLIIQTQEAGNFSIYFLGDGCEVSDCSTPDYIVSNGSTIESIPNSPTFSMMVCKNGGNAGRRDFNFSISCSTIENCVNSVDDDNNGFIDCDDPGCGEKCDYSGTTSSLDGGLESNNRLSNKIASRNYNRAINSNLRAFKDPDFLLGNFTETLNVNHRNDIEVSQLTPWDVIPLTEVVETTPLDLLQITNATDIFAFDIFAQETRVASVLATETAKKVYEHTKYICDRLAGSSIQSVWNYDFGTEYNFIVTKFRDANGSVEYNCNFSMIKGMKGGWTLESHWNLGQYQQGSQTFNFQLWANSTHHLQMMIGRYIEHLENQLGIDKSAMGIAPKMFIKSINYRNKELAMILSNPELLTQAHLKGFQRFTERSASIPFEKRISLAGDKEELIILPTNGIFDISFELATRDDDTPDIVYIADGAWGIDNPKAAAVLHQYEISQDSFLPIESNSFLIERSIAIKGRIKNDLTLFRAITPHHLAVDLKAYNSIEFTAKGTGNMEIVLVHKEIENWEDQIRTSIQLSDNQTVYNIDKEQFDFSNKIDWNAISMIVFTLRGNSESYSPFELHISNLRFKKNEAEQAENIAYQSLIVSPNPMSTEATVVFNTDTAMAFDFQIWSLKGDKVYSLKRLSTRGINQLSINRQSLESGIYVSRLLTEYGDVMVGKLVIL
jgi:hypothetical protein